MEKLTSIQLLQRFVRDRDEDAFSELVQSHVNMVFSVAMRQLRNRQWAEDISQNVFVELLESASKLPDDTVVGAWLYHVTRRRCIDLIRVETRRRTRERMALQSQCMNSAPQEWKEIEPLLDEALDSLGEKDRASIILRFFEGKSFQCIGHEFGVTEDAAQKRLARALQRLSAFFGKRGISTSTVVLTVLFGNCCVHSAPAGLVASVLTSTSLVCSGISSSTIASTQQIISMTTIQKVALTAAVTIVIGTGLYQDRQISHLNDQIHLLQTGSSEEWALMKESLDGQQKALAEAHRDIEKLRDELTDLQTIQAGAKQSPSRDQDVATITDSQPERGLDRRQIEALTRQSHTIPKELWGYAGLETPEDAFLTTVWSASQGNYQTYLGSLNEEGKRRFFEKFDGITQPEIEEAMRQMLEPLKVIRLDRIKRFSESEVTFILPTEEVDDGDTRFRSEAVLTFKKVDDQWLSDGIL